jgi:hypothetical protein
VSSQVRLQVEGRTNKCEVRVRWPSINDAKKYIGDQTLKIVAIDLIGEKFEQRFSDFQTAPASISPTARSW